MTQAVETTDQAKAYYWFIEGALDEMGEIQRVPVLQVPFQIGRSDDLSLRVDFHDVSKVHAQIEFQDGGVFVRDLASKNGTYVNGNRVTGTAPLVEGALLRLGKREFRIGLQRSHGVAPLVEQATPAKRTPTFLYLGSRELGELISTRAVRPIFQPIVELEGGSIFAYDVFGRGTLPGFVSSPSDLFFVAAYLGREEQLSQLMRDKGAEHAERMPLRAPLFFRAHPTEIQQPRRLLQSLAELRGRHPGLPFALVINQSLIVHTEKIEEIAVCLDQLSVRLVYDGFRGPRIRLEELLAIPPDFLKFDENLLQGIHTKPRDHRDMVGRLVAYARESNVHCIADRISRGDEAEICRQIGFHAAQGPYFGTPTTFF
ncbi:MAG: EAL domain-containing protein [Candidatus Sumerlaeaceae bacterium]|nr:EAL domain-containing protein [Candidatus Sumerlaeaceae bacterium]